VVAGAIVVDAAVTGDAVSSPPEQDVARRTIATIRARLMEILDRGGAR
jgi:hypothetical protein